MKKLLISMMALVLALCLGVAGADDLSAVKVAAPAGAPGVALATLAVENPDNYTYVAAETITAEFANENADFIIAPINAGAKLFKMGKSTYKLAAVVTWGNLFFASQRENFKLEDMNGATVTLFGENTINASVALFALEANGVKPAEIAYLGSAANTQALLLSDPDAIVMTAEPALTAASIKSGNITSIGVNELLKAANGSEGFAQAGLFVKAQTAAEQPELVKAYLEKAEAAVNAGAENLEAVVDAAVKLELLPNAKVAAAAIPRCALRFVAAAQARADVETTAAYDLTQYGGELPADDFYYVAE